jgi:hypothetical protein
MPAYFPVPPIEPDFTSRRLCEGVALKELIAIGVRESTGSTTLGRLILVVVRHADTVSSHVMQEPLSGIIGRNQDMIDGPR